MDALLNNKGKIEIDLQAAFESMSGESLVELIESLSCQNAVIGHVAEQIIGAWTENGYCGESAITAKSEPDSPLDEAWRLIAKHSSDVAKREIERLERALATNENLVKSLYDQIRDMPRD